MYFPILSSPRWIFEIRQLPHSEDDYPPHRRATHLVQQREAKLLSRMILRILNILGKIMVTLPARTFTFAKVGPRRCDPVQIRYLLKGAYVTLVTEKPATPKSADLPQLATGKCYQEFSALWRGKEETVEAIIFTTIIAVSHSK